MAAYHYCVLPKVYLVAKTGGSFFLYFIGVLLSSRMPVDMKTRHLSVFMLYRKAAIKRYIIVDEKSPKMDVSATV